MSKNKDYSYQKARFVSDPLEDVAQEQAVWMNETWPEILHLAVESPSNLPTVDEFPQVSLPQIPKFETLTHFCSFKLDVIAGCTEISLDFTTETQRAQRI